MTDNYILSFRTTDQSECDRSETDWSSSLDSYSVKQTKEHAPFISMFTQSNLTWKV